MIIDKHKWKFVKCNIMPALRRAFLDRPSPMFVEFFVTRNCNLSCSYCFTRKKNHNDPSTQELKRRINKLKELGCNVISFMGGEPTLRKDLAELTSYCSKKNMYVSMDTNGLLLDKKMVAELEKAGMSSLVVSLDGIKQLKNSKKTVAENPGIIAVLEYAAKKKKMRVFINLVLTTENIFEVLPLLELVKNKEIIFAISLMAKSPECRAIYDKNKDEYSEEELKKSENLLKFDRLFVELIKKKKKGYSMFEPLEYYEQLSSFIRGKCSWKCRAGRHFFSVDADGRFLLCSDHKPLSENILKLDKNYYSKHKKVFAEQLKKCNSSCTENYAFCSGYYNDHKIKFFTTRF
jgi:MoaA/NifB/PqqE/SkfB family radical SAM enzyme